MLIITWAGQMKLKTRGALFIPYKRSKVLSILFRSLHSFRIITISRNEENVTVAKSNLFA